ncbi:hypothetical protein BGZ49_009478 [Haplosporangium sp. Z 27]|nr:hypothetical protein BGZ49_009478 [Haplosporangium sp. Z 27]
MRFTVSATAVISMIALSANNVQAWGEVGHTITGMIAQQYLTSNTASVINTLLSDYQGQLGNAAPWADSVRGLSSFKWATPLHFFDPQNDDPPTDCEANYVYNGQDSVNALFNMTSQLVTYQQKPPTSATAIKHREEVLKFFVHWMGDIHQPLHDSTPYLGGNQAPIKWGTKTSNLHSMWDTLIITQDIANRFNNDNQAYVDDTLNLAKTYWTDVSTWTNCDASLLEKNPWSSVVDSVQTLCPIQWAKQANALDCSYVWVDYSATRDYSTTYFANVTGKSSGYLVQQQLAKAGVRMAAVLNEVFDPSSSSTPSTTKRRLPEDY